MANPAPTDPWLGPNSPVRPQRPAILIEVLRATTSATGGAFAYQALPNLRCTDVVWRLGAGPKTARLRYVFDGITQGVPQSVEQSLSTAYSGPGVVNVGDRLVIRATRPDGTGVPLFDGFPQEFGMVLDEGTEMAVIDLVGVEYRCRDQPVAGATYRDASQVQSIASSAQFATDLVARPNYPDGLANATDEGYDFDPSPGGSTDAKYPVFLDFEVCRDRAIGRKWTLAMLARYLIFTSNSAQQYVTNPDGAALDALLVAREPKPGAIYDPTDASTYTEQDLIVADRPLTSRDWPGLLDTLVRDKGFGYSFDLSLDDNGNPETSLRLFVINSGTVKDVYLATRGSAFNPETCNVGACEAARSLEPLVNSIVVEGAPYRFEASLILAPGFPSQASDSASATALDAFELNKDINDQDPYRLFVFNEAGDGYYVPGSTSQVLTVPSLDAVFGAGNYIPRRRRTLEELISTEDATNDGPRLRARVSISKDSQQKQPGLWDGTGTWQDVEGSVEFLRDRLGFRITAQSANAWNIGKSDDPSAPYPTGIVKVVECMGNPTTANPAFVARLTCAFDGDQILKGNAAPSGMSISSTTIQRTVDARDRYRKDTVTANSELNPTSDAQTHRDDSTAAQAEADAMRETMENGVFGGTITIPRFTMYYGIGDAIRSIAGRGLPFRLDGGGSQSAPVYPVIEEIHWQLGAEQKTVLTLADEAGFAKKSKRGGGRRR